jgi:hypothetical protein
LQAAQAQAQTKACKRVCFSATQKEIQFFNPTLRCFIFSPPTADTKPAGQKSENLYWQCKCPALELDFNFELFHGGDFANIQVGLGNFVSKASLNLP